MELFRQWREPAAVGLAWMVTAYFSLALRDSNGGVLLLWLPSGVAVAALSGQPRKRWPRLLLALFVAILMTCRLRGIGLEHSLGFGVAQVAEAAICISICRLVLGRHRELRTLRQLTGVFAAALVASAASTLIAFPFRVETGAGQHVWWFFATTLGMLVVTSIILYLRQLVKGRDPRIHALWLGSPADMVAIFVSVFVLSSAILAFGRAALMPLVFCALVLAVLRAGQLGGAFAVFAFAVAATIGARTGVVSSAMFGLTPFAAGLLLQGYMLLMLAMSLPLAATLLARERLETGLRQRNQELKDSLTVLNLTKTLAGVGRWQHDCRTGKEIWSGQMLKLSGLPPTLAPDPGTVRDLLPDGGAELSGQLRAHRDCRIPYSFEYTVNPPGGSERTLKMNAYNEFENGRRVAIFAVAIDVTKERQRERRLDHARSVAVRRATEARRLANTDALTGLANRRCALARLDVLLRRCRRHGTPLSVVMFDIDNFKQVNDGFGHATGDEVLVRVAQLAERLVRVDDMVGRFGGEEFVWLLPEIGLIAAARLAERLRAAICRHSGESGLPPVTISLGLATRLGDECAEDILARADQALYAAKDGGRNQVHLAA